MIPAPLTLGTNSPGVKLLWSELTSGANNHGVNSVGTNLQCKSPDSFYDRYAMSCEEKDLLIISVSKPSCSNNCADSYDTITGEGISLPVITLINYITLQICVCVCVCVCVCIQLDVFITHIHNCHICCIPLHLPSKTVLEPVSVLHLEWPCARRQTSFWNVSVAGEHSYCCRWSRANLHHPRSRNWWQHIVISVIANCC